MVVVIITDIHGHYSCHEKSQKGHLGGGNGSLSMLVLVLSLVVAFMLMLLV